MKKIFGNQILIIALVYLLFTFLLCFFNGWYQNFSDSVHYLWIADKYAEGDWQNAVNTYWGAMISWLLLLFKPLISAPFLRFRVLQLILGFTALLLFRSILKKKQIDTKSTLYYTLVSVPLIISFAWFYLTPDLLLVNGILLAVNFFISDKEINFRRILLAALIGAILFFIKSVGLYFFILMVLGKFISEKKQWNTKSLLHHLSIVLFLIIFCGPWVYFISKKNGSFTMGTSSGHNYKMNSPRITPDVYGEVGNPYHLGTLTESNPPNAFDACVEHAHQNYLSWEGMNRAEIRDHYKKILVKNLKSARSMLFGIDMGTVFILLFFTAAFLYRKEIKPFIIENNIFFLVLFANLLLYLPFFYMDRYLWPALLSLLFLSIVLLNRFPIFKNRFIFFTTLALFLSLNLFSLYKEYQYSVPEKPIIEAIWESNQQVELKRCVWICDKNDKRLGVVKGMVYYNKGQYLGALFYDVDSKEKLKEQLDAFAINTIISIDQKADSLLQNYGIVEVIYNNAPLQVYNYLPKPKPTPRGTVVMLK